MKQPWIWNISLERLKPGGQSLWVLFPSLFTTMINDSEIYKPLIPASERSPPGSLCALKLFQYVESGRRGILLLPVVAQGKPSFLRMAAGQGKQFLSLSWGPEPD